MMADVSSPNASGSTGSRSARAFTLPSQPGNKSGRHSTDSHHHRPHIHHRHNRSHQVHTREPQSAIQQQPNSSSQFVDLFSPVKTAAGGLRDLGSKNASSTAQKDEKEVVNGNVDKIKAEPVQWEDVRKIRLVNEKRADELSSALSKLASTAVEQASSLARTHASLTATLNSTSTTISQLSTLLSSTSELLSKFSNDDNPSLTESTQNQLTALSRTYEQIEKQRLAALEGRICKARRRMGELRDRLEAARDKVEREAIREDEERRRHKRTVGLAWGIVGCVLVVLVVLAWWTRSGSTTIEVSSIDKAKLRAKLKEKGVEWLLDGDKAVMRSEDMRNSQVMDKERIAQEAIDTRETILARLIDEL